MMLKIDPLNFFYCIFMRQFFLKVWNFGENLFSKFFNLEPSWLEVENISPDHFYWIFMWQFLPKWHNLPLISCQIFLALNFSREISCILIVRKNFLREIMPCIVHTATCRFAMFLICYLQTYYYIAFHTFTKSINNNY